LSIHAYRLGFYQTGWIGRASATGVILALVATIASTYMIRNLQKTSRER
jgi:multiple sugar transport system permease protein